MDSKHHDISSSHKPSHVIQNVQDINNEMNTAKNSLAVVTEELNKKKKEIMKYVEMYMKADNDMKAIESITSDATQEKETFANRENQSAIHEFRQS